MNKTNQKSISNTRLGWWLLFGVGLIFSNPERVSAQETCVTTEQYYNGSADADATYCELETQIAVKKFNGKTLFNEKEKEILRDKYNYLTLINVIPESVSNLEVFDFANVTIELATLHLFVSSEWIEEEHHVMLQAYLVIARTKIIESFFNVDLPQMHKFAEPLIDGGTEYIGFEGRAEKFVNCYWRVFVPGRKGIETVSSNIFKDCILGEVDGR